MPVRRREEHSASRLHRCEIGMNKIWSSLLLSAALSLELSTSWAAHTDASSGTRPKAAAAPSPSPAAASSATVPPGSPTVSPGSPAVSPDLPDASAPHPPAASGQCDGLIGVARERCMREVWLGRRANSADPRNRRTGDDPEDPRTRRTGDRAGTIEESPSTASDPLVPSEKPDPKL